MNMKYHIGGLYIKCPYCDSINDNDGQVTEFEENIELECETCGKHFYAKAMISYDTSSDCSINGEDHEWEGSTSETLFNCKNCCQYKVEMEGF